MRLHTVTYRYIPLLARQEVSRAEGRVSILEAEVRRMSCEFGSPSPRRQPLGPRSPLDKTTTPTTPANAPNNAGEHGGVAAVTTWQPVRGQGGGDGARGGFIHMLFGSDA